MPEVKTANPINQRARTYTILTGLRAGMLGGLVAAIGNLIIFLIGQAFLGDSFVVPTFPDGAPGAVSPVNVALYSLVPGVVAGLLLALLNRSASEPVQIMLGISISFLLFSFTAPLGLPSIPDMTRVVLAVMHVVAAVAILGILLRSWQRSVR